MRSTCQSNWVVVVVIKIVDEMYVGGDWAKKMAWASMWVRCKVEFSISFGWTFCRVVEHVEKLLTMVLRLLLSAERLFWDWNSKWVLVGWIVPKEEAWQAWMRFSWLFAVSLRVYLKIDLDGRRNELQMNENVVIFLVIGVGCLEIYSGV